MLHTSYGCKGGLVPNKILLWRRQWHPAPVLLPWSEEPGRLQSMGSLRVGHDWATSLSLFTFPALEKEMATHSRVLAWRIPGTAEPDGLLSMGSHRVGHDWIDLVAAIAAAAAAKSFSVRMLLTIQSHAQWGLVYKTTWASKKEEPFQNTPSSQFYAPSQN